MSRNKLEADIAAIIKSLEVGWVVEEGKQLTGYMLFKLGKRGNNRNTSSQQQENNRNTSSQQQENTRSQQEEEEDRKAWEDLSSLERRLYIEAKKNFLQQIGKTFYCSYFQSLFMTVLFPLAALLSVRVCNFVCDLFLDNRVSQC